MKELFGVVRTYFEASYEALRERREYLEYRNHDHMGVGHLERVRAADCGIYKMLRSGRKQRKALAMKTKEAETKIISQRRAPSNMPGSAGKSTAHCDGVKIDKRDKTRKGKSTSGDAYAGTPPRRTRVQGGSNTIQTATHLLQAALKAMLPQAED